MHSHNLKQVKLICVIARQPVFSLHPIIKPRPPASQARIIRSARTPRASAQERAMAEPNSSSKFKKVAVFCGASSGNNPAYVEAAKALANEMVKRKIGLVYGGGNVGLMGAVAETVAAGLGEESVIGVIPGALAPREISGTTVGDIRVVDSMHSRKALMFDLADAFITIPGGFGTLDEMLEITTWQQLGFHDKPVGVLNSGGFFDHLLAFLDHATAEGFIRPASRSIVVSETTPAALLDALEKYEAPMSLIRLASEGKLGIHERG